VPELSAPAEGKLVRHFFTSLCTASNEPHVGRGCASARLTDGKPVESGQPRSVGQRFKPNAVRDRHRPPVEHAAIAAAAPPPPRLSGPLNSSNESRTPIALRPHDGIVSRRPQLWGCLATVGSNN